MTNFSRCWKSWFYLGTCTKCGGFKLL